jgi:acetyltransferase-like isoleucine patch superfamily enzyme
MDWYIKRFQFFLYFLIYSLRYKYLDIRAFLYFSVKVEGSQYISVGRGTMIQRQGWLLALKIDDHLPELSIGKDCAIGDFCHIASVRSVVIQDNVLIANKVYISDNVHSFEDIMVPIMNQPIKYTGNVIIGTGAWIGENVCIIGAKIGRNSIIGANSVVTKDIPDYCVAVGIPARVIKMYDQRTSTWVKTGS